MTLPSFPARRSAELLRGIEATLEIHYDNLENLDTPGFKGRHASGVRDFQAGVIEGTCRPLDLAISGRGFFVVKRLDGSLAFSRAGRLTLDAKGRLCLENGFRLDPAIVVPEGAMGFGIDELGRVTVSLADRRDAQREVGRIRLARFRKRRALRRLDRLMFASRRDSGRPDFGVPGDPCFGRLQQSFLERSNVDRTAQLIAIDELTERWRFVASSLGLRATERARSVGYRRMKVGGGIDTRLGKFEKTKRVLDLAIDGAGFFRVLLEDGREAFVRSSRFRVQSEGYVVDSSGNRLLPEFVMPPNVTRVVISRSGDVEVSTRETGAKLMALGGVCLTRFERPEHLLQSKGGPFFAQPAAGRASEGKPGENGFGAVLTGALEVPRFDLDREVAPVFAYRECERLVRKVLGRRGAPDAPASVDR